MQVTAIIAAGGRGQRFGGSLPKQFATISGRTLLELSVGAFLSHPEISEVIVALPPDMAADPPAYLRGASKPITTVAGGTRRQDSVMNAFRAIDERSDLVVIHDAARPFASAALISRTIAAAAESGAAVAALQARDTVKRLAEASVDAEAGTRFVAETLTRESIFLAQTPQAFRREVLRLALAAGEREATTATDEAALAELAGHRVRLVDGEVTNIKITTPEDLALADAMTGGRGLIVSGAGRPARTGRAGTGYDLHRLVDGRPLVLGGVTIPFERGLTGHSDADAICHAITDAVLGAAAAGDIGRHFPDTDGRWKGASSIDLLRRAAQVVRDQGLTVGNVDATVILERPKLAPFIDQMRANIAEALGIGVDRVSVKGKTNEGVGELGAARRSRFMRSPDRQL